MALDVAGDFLLTDPAEIAGASRAHLTQEPADDRQVADNGLRRQTAFLVQIMLNASKICSCGVSGGNATGTIVPASRSTNSKRLSAAWSPGWIDWLRARRRRYRSTMRSSRSANFERLLAIQLRSPPAKLRHRQVPW
jgi:hypothetical protein